MPQNSAAYTKQTFWNQTKQTPHTEGDKIPIIIPNPFFKGDSKPIILENLHSKVGIPDAESTCFANAFLGT